MKRRNQEWLIPILANTGLLGFDKERRFGSILGIFDLHKKQRWKWVRATNREG